MTRSVLLASLLSVFGVIAAHAAELAYPPAGMESLGDPEVSPKGTLRIERYATRDRQHMQVWLIDERQPTNRARVPEVALRRGGTTKTNGFMSRFHFSPDERYPFLDQRAYGFFVFERVRGVQYWSRFPQELVPAIVHLFTKQQHLPPG